MSKPILFAMLALALAASACGININLPEAQVPGPDLTDEISIPAPDSNPVRLTLEFGAGELHLAPGAEAGLVNGTATYNVPDFKPEVKMDGGHALLKQGEYRVSGIPNFDGLKNEWNLRLGSQPMALEIKAGAYQGEFDLGGLALSSLAINDGAAEVTIDFSAPNPETMSLFSYKTGASNVTLKNLANANFVSMVFESGAGNYKLDFGGGLQRDASLSIRSGMSNLTLVIPEGVAATVKVNGGLSNVQFPAGWAQQGDLVTQSGDGPTLTVVIEMGAGNVQITK
ncbi:MAG: toast rack family protein [Anaerolineales bacterium]